MCLQNELAKSVDENSCMLHYQTVFLIVGGGVPSQLNYLPQQSNLASVGEMGEEGRSKEERRRRREGGEEKEGRRGGGEEEERRRGGEEEERRTREGGEEKRRSYKLFYTEAWRPYT